MHALDIIKREHHNVGILLDCLDEMAQEVLDTGRMPDLRVFHAALNYIDSFLDEFHHPKEDRYLYAASSDRHPGCAALVDSLHAEHRQGTELLRGMRFALAACEYEYEPALGSLAESIRRYVEFERGHAHFEETEIFPLAVEHLAPEDWERLHAAFAENRDPLFGERRRNDYEILFRRISHLMPSPLAVEISRRRVPADGDG